MTTAEKTSPAEQFYGDALDCLLESGLPFMVGGAFSMRHYADIHRDTKDLDLFCKPGDHPRVLQALQDAGYRTEITDATWLAKAFCDDHLVDIIFGSANNVCPVDESWFEHAVQVEILGRKVRLMPAEEVLWTKMLVEDRHRFDGADVNHIVRKQGPELDWKRLLMRMEPYWEIFLSHLLQFRFIYPSERNVVPEWLMKDLLSRVETQLTAPVPVEAVCRGPLLSKTQYLVDIEEWGYRER
jgi:Uncharacterised nucleotidyltransferase